MRKFNVNVNGKDYIVEIEESGANDVVAAAPAAPAQAPAAPAQAPAAPAAPAQAPAGACKIESPMPGPILDVKVSVRQTVKAGDIICILEAMKMENDIVASQDGKVASVVASGAQVNTGDVLASLE